MHTSRKCDSRIHAHMHTHEIHTYALAQMHICTHTTAMLKSLLRTNYNNARDVIWDAAMSGEGSVIVTDCS